METIAGIQTQTDYVDALTIHPFAWQEIEVAVNDAPVMMQLYELDEHRGGYQGGDWKSEMLVDPATLTLSKVGGVRFRTNPATPGLAGNVFAVARAEGDPVVAGLQPRKQLSSIFGPTLFDGVVSVPNGAGLRTLFASGIPGSWSSVLLHLDQTAIGAGCHYQAQWTHGSTAIQNFDFYGNLNVQAIAIPILGDSLVLTARHSQATPRNITVQAYLTNLAPFSVWARSEWLLFYLASQLLQASSILTLTALPVFAGTATISFDIAAGAPGIRFQVLGQDENGNTISEPYNQLLLAGTDRFQDSILLAPHINALRFFSGGAPDTTISGLTVIGERA